MKNLLILGLGAALLAACRPDDVVECGPQTNAFADLTATSPPTQKFILTLNQAQTVRTQRGATMSFPANGFIQPDGTLASGQAELRVREIYTVADMLLADMPTNIATSASSPQLLISGGEFNIQVWQGSARLRLARAVGPTNPSGSPYMALTSPIPAAGLDTTRMLLWNQPSNGSILAARDSAGWRPSLTAGGMVTQVASSAGYYSASLPLDSIGWWNIDRFWHAYQSRAGVSIGVAVPNSNTATLTRVYFRPVGFNGLARCRQLTTANPGTASCQWEPT